MSSDPQKLIVYSANLASACLSLFGSVAIVVNYIFFTNKSQLLYKLIFFLSLADFGGSLSIAISQILLFVDSDQHIYTLDVCIFFRAAINFFFVSSFVWTACISIHIWVCSRQKAQIPIVWFHAFSWGIPAVLTAVQVGAHMIEKEKDAEWCHLTPAAHWVFWFGPLMASFLWSAVFYTLILQRFRVTTKASNLSLSFMGDRQRRLQWKVQKRLTLYLLAFAICWIWEIVNNILSSVFNISPYWLWLLQSIFSPLQGFLNFLAYGISSRMFRHRVKYRHGTASENKRILINNGDM